jgi:hypothetical protein
LMPSSGSQTAYFFLRVLMNLRQWKPTSVTLNTNNLFYARKVKLLLLTT